MVVKWTDFLVHSTSLNFLNLVPFFVPLNSFHPVYRPTPSPISTLCGVGKAGFCRVDPPLLKGLLVPPTYWVRSQECLWGQQTGMSPWGCQADSSLISTHSSPYSAGKFNPCLEIRRKPKTLKNMESLNLWVQHLIHLNVVFDICWKGGKTHCLLSLLFFFGNTG
jgi:hypothetical protein